MVVLDEVNNILYKPDQYHGTTITTKKESRAHEELHLSYTHLSECIRLPVCLCPSKEVPNDTMEWVGTQTKLKGKEYNGGSRLA
jgi:hypothetical protein